MRFHPLGLGLITLGLLLLGSAWAFRLDQPVREHAPEEHPLSFPGNAPVASVFGGAFLVCGIAVLIAKRHQPLDRSEQGLGNPPQQR